MFTTIVAFVMSAAISVSAASTLPTNHIRMSHVTGGVVYVTEWDENTYGMHMNHNSYETTYEEWING